MDVNNIIMGGISGSTFTLTVFIIYKMYRCINHRRIRSSCCGKKMEASLDIDKTSSNGSLDSVDSNSKEKPLIVDVKSIKDCHENVRRTNYQANSV